MLHFKSIIAWSWVAVLLTTVGCAAPAKMMGANYLQSRSVKMDSDQSRLSLTRLRGIGANTVAFIPFMEQASTNVAEVRFTGKVTDEQLRAAIRDSRSLGLRVVLKPQILVPDSWAGKINMDGDSAWKQWFVNYGRLIGHYADIAEEEGADIFVIGTELNQTAELEFWQPLISDIRRRFNGKLTYAAQNIEGLKKFGHWDSLDIVSLTLYPSLGESPDAGAMSQHISKVAEELKAISRQLARPLWIVELGIPSRSGAQLNPWEWQGGEINNRLPDENLQAVALDLWLESLSGNWNIGVMLWNWRSDPAAGGPDDNDYTIQNKRAEQVVKCRWTERCSQQ